MFGLFRRKKKSAAMDATSHTPDSKAFDRSLVMPLVKAVVGEESGVKVIELPEDDAPISRPFVADLIVMYVLDYPDRFEFISPRHLRENGITQDELHALAIGNLPLRVPKVEVHGTVPCQMITAGGNLEATLLLLDPLWEQLSETLPGDPMAVVPARDLLCVSGSGWEGAHEFLSGVANKELPEKRYALSTCVLVRREGQLRQYAPAS